MNSLISWISFIKMHHDDNNNTSFKIEWKIYKEQLTHLPQT